MSEEDIKKVESLCDERTDYWIWILSILTLALLNNVNKENSNINIYLGDE